MNMLDTIKMMKKMGASRTSAIQMLKKQGIEEYDHELTEVYGEATERKADWEERVTRLRELVRENKYTQKRMAEICVDEGLFGGMASAKQCMPYINMAIEWANQEKAAQ